MDVDVTRAIEATGEVIAALLAQAQLAPQVECCGLLLGSPGRITRAQPTVNVHSRPARHFEIDSAALIGAYRAERGGGPVLIGFYHSHPNGHPRPSAEDCEHAAGDGRVWAITASGQVHCWRDTRSGFTALPLVVVSG